MIKIVREENKNINYIEKLKERAEELQVDVNMTVQKILEDVRKNGDEAVLNYTNKFDSCNVKSLLVTEKEIEDAYKSVEKEFIDAILLAKENIECFHRKQKNNSWIMTKDKGITMGQTVRGLDRVGVYVPGGKASYPSSVLMNVIPAKVAEVNEIIMVTPPSKDGSINPNILVAAKIAGVDKIYKVGGAQAIGALAYGTESIFKVDKIVGPGNIYVALAKKAVYGNVDIDMIAGPSEILIISDENGEAKYIAADLISQAEHDKLASSILVTTSEKLANDVYKEIQRQVETLERKEIIKESLKNYGAIIVTSSIKKAIEIANTISPEHLELMVNNPFVYLGNIKNAGSIFLGKFSPEPLGDYMAGPNHVLPTSGTAKFFSPLSVDDFIKKSSYIYYSRDALEDVKDKIIKIAETEKLTAHANSIKVRFEK
ncbi:histidinol dehydrogenase [Clostridium oceanicum]|uniref:Histidinol dehydrogenase n=1 Tax=Clostridium oceanicum TaxID=1543 RepID=A0ABP3V7P6_9CLOT